MIDINESQFRQEYKELKTLLDKPNIYQDSNYPKIAKDYKHLSDVIHLLDNKKHLKKNKEETEDLLDTNDDNFAKLVQSEINDIDNKINDIDQKLTQLLSVDSSDNHKDCILEIRAGVGGAEASLFAADLHRMYVKFCENKGWKITLINQNPSDAGGFKEIISEIHGQDVYKLLQFESGVHRVQRIPKTESQGRIHTSTATVVVMPQVDEEELEIPDSDLRIDTYRSSGPGGQSVNTTDSAVRITHIPTNIIVTCQDGKSQFKNKERALSILRTRLIENTKQAQQDETSQKRQKLIGRAFRNEKIRTYNFPQDRLTDHRIKLNISNLDKILNGSLDHLINKLHNYDLQTNN